MRTGETWARRAAPDHAPALLGASGQGDGHGAGRRARADCCGFPSRRWTPADGTTGAGPPSRGYRAKVSGRVYPCAPAVRLCRGLRCRGAARALRRARAGAALLPRAPADLAPQPEQLQGTASVPASWLQQVWDVWCQCLCSIGGQGQRHQRHRHHPLAVLQEAQQAR